MKILWVTPSGMGLEFIMEMEMHFLSLLVGDWMSLDMKCHMGLLKVQPIWNTATSREQ